MAAAAWAAVGSAGLAGWATAGSATAAMAEGSAMAGGGAAAYNNAHPRHDFSKGACSARLVQKAPSASWSAQHKELTSTQRRWCQ
jgi:hypothetical protein